MLLIDGEDFLEEEESVDGWIREEKSVRVTGVERMMKWRKRNKRRRRRSE